MGGNGWWGRIGTDMDQIGETGPRDSPTSLKLSDKKSQQAKARRASQSAFGSPMAGLGEDVKNEHISSVILHTLLFATNNTPRSENRD